jgi:hypothetical protein
MGSNDLQRFGLRHPQAHALLKQPEKIAGFLAAFFGERRRFDFSVQPRQRLSPAWFIRFISHSILRHRAILARQ